MDFNFAPLIYQVSIFFEELVPTVQSNNKIAAHIVSSQNTAQRIEVVIDEHESENVMTLRCSTWTEGIGWCGQKTIRLDADQLDELHRALTVARHRLNSRRAQSGTLAEVAQVIQFPTIG